MKKMSNFEIGAITYFLIRAYFVGLSFNILLNTSKQQSFVSMIISLLLGIVYLVLFFYIQDYEPNLTIIEKNTKLFGSIIGSIINIIISITTLLFIILLYINTLNIIHVEYLNKTPLFLISLYFMTTVYYCIKKEIFVISKACLILLYFSFILIALGNISLLFQINYNNFKPLFFTDTILTSSIYYLTLNILPLYLLNIIPKNRISNSKKTKFTILIFYIIANLTIIIENLNIIGVLGVNLCKIYKYPEFQILKNISLINLTSRIDSIFFMKTIVDSFIFIIIGSYYIIENIKRISNKNNNIVILLYCLFIFIISLNQSINYLLNMKILKIICVFFFISISTITLLICYKIKYSKEIKS